MTKKEFLRYERICKEAWKEMYETGANSKPIRLLVFKHSCPACEIASKLSKDFLNCSLCPIDLWREFARSRGDEAVGMAVCQDFDEVSLYNDWMNGESSESREAAKKISELKWSWLPEYKNVESVLGEYYENIKTDL